jgi:hypothetical protein
MHAEGNVKKISIYAAMLVIAFLLVGFQNGLFDFASKIKSDAAHLPQQSGDKYTGVAMEHSTGSDNATEGSAVVTNGDPISDTSLEAFLAFEEESKGLLAELELLNHTERGLRLDQYLEGMERFEADSRFIAQEAMLMKIKILSLRQLEQSVLEEQSLAIVDEYRIRNEQAAKKFRDNPSNELIAYKAEALLIAKEVEAMGDGAFGDGVSRNEYLRQQLQQARVAIYGGTPK